MTNPTRRDRFTEIFAWQEDLARYYARVRPNAFYAYLPPLLKCQTWIHALQHELCELEDEFPWKPWKNQPDAEDTRAARLEEMADILHFFVQLALDQGFDADEVYAAYKAKNRKNRERQQSDPQYRLGESYTGGSA